MDIVVVGEPARADPSVDAASSTTEVRMQHHLSMGAGYTQQR